MNKAQAKILSRILIWGSPLYSVLVVFLFTVFFDKTLNSTKDIEPVVILIFALFAVSMVIFVTAGLFIKKGDYAEKI